MPSPLYAMQERDFAAVIREAATCFTFAGKRIPCTFGATDDDWQLAADGGGELPVYNLVATVLKCSFAKQGISIPKKGEEIEAEEKKYQVGRTASRPGSPLVKIYCGNLDA